MQEFTFKIRYNQKDILIYNLGIGGHENCYVNELDDSFGTPISFMHSLCYKGIKQDVIPFPPSSLINEKMIAKITSYGYDANYALHGAQEIQMFDQIPIPYINEMIELECTCEMKFMEAKKSHMYVEFVTNMYYKSKLLCKERRGLLIRGNGDSDLTRDIKSLSPLNYDIIPKIELPLSIEPSFVCNDQIGGNQTLIYRLSGDYNPLHIDTVMSEMVGIEKPFLQGVCVLGFVLRGVKNPLRLKRSDQIIKVSGRFKDKCFNGDKIETVVWKINEYDFLFQTKTQHGGGVERVLIDNGCFSIISQPSSHHLSKL